MKNKFGEDIKMMMIKKKTKNKKLLKKKYIFCFLYFIFLTFQFGFCWILSYFFSLIFSVFVSSLGLFSFVDIFGCFSFGFEFFLIFFEVSIIFFLFLFDRFKQDLTSNKMGPFQGHLRRQIHSC